MINRKTIFTALILLIIAGSYLANNIIKKTVLQDSKKNDDLSLKVDDYGNYTRIISLAPNITETLFTLGLGERIVGVTRFCKYPVEALKKEKVGGFLIPIMRQSQH